MEERGQEQPKTRSEETINYVQYRCIGQNLWPCPTNRRKATLRIKVTAHLLKFSTKSFQLVLCLQMDLQSERVWKGVRVRLTGTGFYFARNSGQAGSYGSIRAFPACPCFSTSPFSLSRQGRHRDSYPSNALLANLRRGLFCQFFKRPQNLWKWFWEPLVETDTVFCSPAKD